MKNLKRLLAVAAATGLLLANVSLSMAADQQRDQLKKRDGSCQDLIKKADHKDFSVSYGGSGKGDSIRDRKRDGSCQD